MNPQTPILEGTRPKGYLTFKAIKQVDGDRITYVGAMPVFDLIDKGFVAPVASAGLSPEILSLQLDRPLFDKRARLRGAVDRNPLRRRSPRGGSFQRRRGSASLPRLGG